MPLPKSKAWFRAKTYGWGWGLPCRWQGWAVMTGFMLALIAGSPLVARSPTLFVGYSIAITAALVGICYWKGEKTGWRWRDGPE
jgi:hypothetical protein